MQLVQRTLAGDSRAFDMLVVKYQRRVERLVGRLVRDVDLVQDIAQETFLKAYRGLAGYRGDAQFYTWLYRIAVNTAKKKLVELRKDPLITEAAMLGADDEDETSLRQREPSSDETPESMLASRQIADAVHVALGQLPEELRQALVLREIEGLSYDEIALVMDCPIGTVRSRIFRARDAISVRIRPMLDKQSGKRW